MNKDNILGVSITTSSEDGVLEYITIRLKNNIKKLFIVTPNPEMIVFAGRNFEFKSTLNKADIALPDGMGVVWASKLLGKGVKGRIAGVDMVFKICHMLSQRGLTAGFLGGKDGVAEKTVECLVKRYPKLRVAFVGREPSEDWYNQIDRHGTTQNVTRKNAEVDSVVQRNIPRGSAIDFLFVAYGFPKQEKWIWENLDRIPVKAAMGVGGAFDYISGKVPRAPKLIRDFGLEWLYRLIIEPWRWRRQLALLQFIWLVVKEMVRMKIIAISKQ